MAEINYFFLWEFRLAEFPAFTELPLHESDQELTCPDILSTRQNFKIYVRLPHIFYASNYHFREIKILNLLLSTSRSSSQTANLESHRSMANVSNLRMYPVHFSTSSYHFRDITNLKLKK